MLRARLLLALALSVPLPVAAELHVWVDEQGVTHVTDDPDSLPAGQAASDPGDLRLLWGGMRWESRSRPRSGTPPAAPSAPPAAPAAPAAPGRPE